MKDPIERQEAIIALAQVCEDYGCEMLRIEEMADILGDVPSAWERSVEDGSGEADEVPVLRGKPGDILNT